MPVIRRRRDGTYSLRLDADERDALRSLPGQLRELLTTDDPVLDRLFPPAYTDDAEASAEYARLMRDDLMSGRLSSIAVMEATIDAERLDEAQVVAWMGAINDLRLVLGTRLDVSEEMEFEDIAPDDPRYGLWHLYLWLGWLQENVVEALAGSD